jgi:hypothetical protein
MREILRNTEESERERERVKVGEGEGVGRYAGWLAFCAARPGWLLKLTTLPAGCLLA